MLRRDQMKKATFLIFLLSSLMLSGCTNKTSTEKISTDKVSTDKTSIDKVSADSANNINNPREKEDETVMENMQITYQKKAESLYEKILELYSVEGTNLFLENYPPKPEDNVVLYLWPYSAMFSAANAIIKLPGNKEKYIDSYEKILAGLEHYYDDIRKPAAYEAYPGEFGGSDRYYDDNMWLGLDFIEAYRTFGDKKYLEKAERIFEFVKSGWTDELGGGIYWCEQKKESKNTCSNGPAAILALMLYEETQKEEYYEWGLKIYNWTKDNLQSPSGVYWDNIDLKGNIDKATYTYNSGTMLHASVLLYNITKEDKYLLEAQKVAKASLEHFTEKKQDICFYPANNPWFTDILYRGYIELYKVDGNPRYINSIIDNIDYAWENARDENGLLESDWSGVVKNRNRPLLDVSCMVEMYARTALLRD